MKYVTIHRVNTGMVVLLIGDLLKMRDGIKVNTQFGGSAFCGIGYVVVAIGF